MMHVAYTTWLWGCRSLMALGGWWSGWCLEVLESWAVTRCFYVPACGLGLGFLVIGRA